MLLDCIFVLEIYLMFMVMADLIYMLLQNNEHHFA
jgi:hypothetical protein